MKGLLYKDYTLFKKSFFTLGWIIGFIIFVSILITLMHTSISVPNEELGLEIAAINTFIYLCAFAILPFITSPLFSSDEKPTSVCFLFSTPAGAKGQIQSKYYFLLLVNLSILFLCFLADVVIVLIVGEYAVSTLLPCIIFFSISLILLAIRIPFSIRFGSNLGFEVEIVYITLFSAFIYIYGLFGDISFFFKDFGDKAPIDLFLEYLLSEKVIFLLSLIPYIAVLTYYLSYRISLKLYRKGVESYEQ